MPTIHGFFKDAAFVDRTNIVRPDNPGGSLFVPSNQSRSYFQTLTEVNDTRASRDWIGAYSADTLPVVLIDGVEFSEFATYFETLASAERDAFFAILDRLFIHSSSTELQADIETDLTTDAAYNIYKPVSLTRSTEFNTGEAFNAAGTLVEAPAWAQFSIFTTGSEGQEEHEVKIWADDAVFKTDYPIASITNMIPTLPYSTLLTGPLTGGGSNVFDAAKNATELMQAGADSFMAVDHQTGIHLQNITLYDASNNARPVPFAILHKGLTPDLLSIRTAVREGVLASGTGTEQAWRVRAPELFIVDQFYIVPMWHIVTTLPDGSINPSVISVSAMLTATKTALSSLSSAYVDENLESLSVTYNAMMAASLPHPDNINYQSISEIHPTYQNYAASEPGFAQMEAHTKLFSTRLNTAMAVAAGATTDPLYPARQEGDLTYIPIVVGTTEYYVMTQESFLNKLGV